MQPTVTGWRTFCKNYPVTANPEDAQLKEKARMEAYALMGLNGADTAPVAAPAFSMSIA